MHIVNVVTERTAVNTAAYLFAVLVFLTVTILPAIHKMTQLPILTEIAIVTEKALASHLCFFHSTFVAVTLVCLILQFH